MEKEKISMKGGKYPQDFQEKLMTLSLNADIMSSMVLKKEEVAEEIINIVRDAINKGKKKKAKVHLELIKVQYSVKNWNGGRNIVIDFIAYCPEENTIYIIEPQCYWQKNIYYRNRYYGSMIDTDNLKVGQDFSEIPKRCMIVLTEKDFNSKDPMIQHIKLKTEYRNCKTKKHRAGNPFPALFAFSFLFPTTLPAASFFNMQNFKKSKNPQHSLRAIQK